MDDTLLELLASIGIKVAETETENILTCKFHYNNNLGYYHIISSEWEIAVLKSVHKDFIREIYGKCSVTERDISRLSDLLSNIEKNIDYTPVSIFSITEGEWYLHNLFYDEEFVKNYSKSSHLPIQKPLAEIEYQLSTENHLKGDSLYFSNIMSFLPETVSYPLADIIKSIPGMLNPLFEHSNFKTFDPSIKTIFHKPYANLKTFILCFETFLSNENFLRYSYLPHSYIRENRQTFKEMNISKMAIESSEILEFLDEIQETLEKIDESFIMSKEFGSYLSLIAMTSLMIFLNMTNYFISIIKRIGNTEEAVKLIYKTRANSIFSQENEIILYKKFDFCADGKNIVPKIDYIKEDIEQYIKNLPFTLRMFGTSKLINMVNTLHKILDIRDRLYLTVNKICHKVNQVWDDVACRLVEKQQLRKKEDIYYLEIGEIQNILNDSFYGNIPFTLFFRKSQLERFKAQPVVTEIYEKDIGESWNISFKLIKSLKDKHEHGLISLFHSQDRDVEISSIMDIKRSGCIVGSHFSLIDIIECHKQAESFIAESIPISSYLTEYAALTNTPVYSGVRFPNAVLSGKKAALSRDKIILK